MKQTLDDSLTGPSAVVAATDPNVSWQAGMKRAIRSAAELAQRLGLDERFIRSSWGEEGESSFAVFVPLEYLARIRPRDPHDPLLRQVWPAREEGVEVAGFSTDPVGEVGQSRSAAGHLRVLSKYSGRALLIAHQACGIHCRYCFRRHFPYSVASQLDPRMDDAIRSIEGDDSIEEVILSGGDPLVINDPPLKELVDRICRIPHVRRLRIHSRMPIVIPQRVNKALLDLLRNAGRTVWMVVHCNHPQELDPQTLAALARLVDAGIPVLNQAVLLSGVNDSIDVLEGLCKKLIDHRVQPYYLHQLDRVAGGAHFEVPQERGRELIAQLRARLSGFGVPIYVREVAGETSKLPLESY